MKSIAARNKVVSQETPSSRANSYQMTWKYNPILHKVLINYLRPAEREEILDIGCGRGFCVQEVEHYSDRVIGVDISASSLEEAVTPKVIYGDAMNLSFQDNSFDKIYSLHTVEHVPSLEKFFSEIARVIRPDGTVITIYPWEPIRGIGAVAAAVRQYKNPFKARQIHLHRLTPKRIKRLVSGLPLIHVESKFIFAAGFHYITVLRKPASLL